VFFATGGRGERLVNITRDAMDSHFASLGLRLGEVHLQGTSPAARAEILRAAALPLGAPIMTLNLDAIRRRVESVGWVDRARIIRLLPDTLVISVDERPLIAIWQHAGRNVVIASNGAVMNKVDPARFGGLPLVVGEGANTAAAPILKLVSDRPRLSQRLNSLTRVDGRRWDLQLKDGCLVMLPASYERVAPPMASRACFLSPMGNAGLDDALVPWGKTGLVRAIRPAPPCTSRRPSFRST
jgi:cell division protein FtsQ